MPNDVCTFSERDPTTTSEAYIGTLSFAVSGQQQQSKCCHDNTEQMHDKGDYLQQSGMVIVNYH